MDYSNEKKKGKKLLILIRRSFSLVNCKRNRETEM